MSMHIDITVSFSPQGWPSQMVVAVTGNDSASRPSDAVIVEVNGEETSFEGSRSMPPSSMSTPALDRSVPLLGART